MDILSMYFLDYKSDIPARYGQAPTGATAIRGTRARADAGATCRSGHPDPPRPRRPAAEATPMGDPMNHPTRTPRLRGPWNGPAMADFLDASRIPLRLACTGSRGFPVIASLWFLPEGLRLWCATPASSAVARHLARDPRCAFEVAGDAPPYRGVRGQGRAELHPDRGREVLGLLVDRYLGSRETPLARWLLGRGVPEVAIALEARQLTSWDFTRRMAPEPGNRSDGRSR